MPPKLVPKPPKPTLGAESGLQSGEAHHSTDRRYLPVRGHKELTKKEMEKVVGTFFWYEYHDRPLILDEIQGMISSEFREEKTGKFLNNRFYLLEEYEKDINAKNPDRVRAEVDSMYDKYCKGDQDAEDRRRVLMGL